jgi:hypothetical protein
LPGKKPAARPAHIEHCSDVFGFRPTAFPTFVHIEIDVVVCESYKMFPFLFSHADNVLGAESYRAVFGYIAGFIRVVRDSGVKKAFIPLRNITLEILVYGAPAPVIAVSVAVPSDLPVPQIECIHLVAVLGIAGFARGSRFLALPLSARPPVSTASGNANNALFFTVSPLSLICSAAQAQHADTIARRWRTCQETAERRRSAAVFAAKGFYLYIEFP